jgi:uncharacterized protein (TIGR01244 family)
MITTRFSRTVLLLTFLTVVAAFPPLASSQQQAPPAQPPAGAKSAAPPAAASAGLHGVRNFTSIDSTFALGGSLAEGSLAALKEAGFVTVVNLRAASEEGANVEGEIDAAKRAGIRYVHLPFVAASPDATKLDEFLEIVSEPAAQPVLLHCTSGGRASMFWAIKRVLVDGWTFEKATAEVPERSQTWSDPLKAFGLEYLKTHGK